MAGGLLRIHLVWRDVADTMSAGWMWAKSVLPLQSVKNYSNSRVLGYGQLGDCPKTLCKF